VVVGGHLRDRVVGVVVGSRRHAPPPTTAAASPRATASPVRILRVMSQS
jgi:hypothetical protein